MQELEIWKDIPDYEGLYQVSNYGQVKSLERIVIRKDGNKKTIPERILKPNKKKNRYLSVALCKDNKQKSFLVHKLVALTFLKNPNNLPQINHIDENKENNRVENLEFCTAQHNINYGTRNERVSEKTKGKPRAYLRKPIIQYTKEGEYIREWDSATQVEKELNIYQTSITKCCKGKRKTCGNFLWRYKE